MNKNLKVFRFCKPKVFDLLIEVSNKQNKLMMKYKVLFLLMAISLMSFNAHAQRGVRIGYIDTEYILQNIIPQRYIFINLQRTVGGEIS